MLSAKQNNWLASVLIDSNSNEENIRWSLAKVDVSTGEFIVQEGKEVKANIGRFGPYVQLDRTFASIPKDSGLDARSIQLDDALKLITAKLKADEERFIQVFEDGAIQVLKGRYGPYIKQGKKNFKIPKDADPAKLTLDEVKDIIANAPPPKRGRRKGK